MLDKMTNRTEQGEQVNPRILQKNKLKLNLGNAMNTRQRGLMNNHDVLFFFGFFSGDYYPSWRIKVHFCF